MADSGSLTAFYSTAAAALAAQTEQLGVPLRSMILTSERTCEVAVPGTSGKAGVDAVAEFYGLPPAGEFVEFYQRGGPAQVGGYDVFLTAFTYLGPDLAVPTAAAVESTTGAIDAPPPAESVQPA